MPIPGLPNELGEEILCRVPPIYLNRLRSTCKRWNYLVIADCIFAKIHSDKSSQEFLILLLTKKSKISSMSVDLHGIVPSLEVKGELSLPDPHYNKPCQLEITRVFHCDGLLLCSFDDESTIVVWNPCTGRTRWIDAGKRDREGRIYVLGYPQDKKSCYKILSFYTDGSKDYSEIYEFSSDSWRTLDHDIAPGWFSGYSTVSVSLKGSSYWFAHDLRKKQDSMYLHRFDFSTEKSCAPIPLPYGSCTIETAQLSVVRDEKISVLLKLNNTSKTEIWVTNKIDDTKAVSWSKLLELDLSYDLQISFLGSFLVDEEKKILVCCQRWIDPIDEYEARDMVYIVGEDNKVTQVNIGIDTIEDGWPIILNYVPRLVQIERPGSNKRKRADAISSNM